MKKENFATNGTVIYNFYEDSAIEEQAGQADKELRRRKRDIFIGNLGVMVSVNYLAGKDTYKTFTQTGTIKMIGLNEVSLEVDNKAFWGDDRKPDHIPDIEEIRIKLDNIIILTF